MILYENISPVLFYFVGFEHEQNRPDRDNFVQIIWNNIPNDEGKYIFVFRTFGDWYLGKKSILKIFKGDNH